MKKNIYTLLSFIFILSIKASNTDSLYSLIENHQKQDSIYVRLIYDYCFEKSFKSYSTEDLELMKKGLAVSKELDLGIEKAYMHNILGWYFQSRSNLKDALVNFQKAIEISEKEKNNAFLFEVLTNLANTYNSTQDFDKALSINLKLIDLVKNDTSSSKKARVYYYTAATYDALEDYTNSEKYFLETKRISKEANFKMGIVLANSNLAHTYNQQEKYNKALPLLLESVDFYKKAGHKTNLAGNYSTLAYAYKGLEDYKTAADYYEKAIAIYLEIDKISYLKFNYTWLAYSYHKNGDFNKSQKNYDQALLYADSLYNQERVKAIEDVKIEYETDKFKQEKELAEANELLANEKANFSKIVSISIGVISFLILGLLVFIFNRLKLIRKQKIELDSAYEQLEESKKNELAVSNLKALQSQMNPHFIFNALNSVQDLVLLQDIRNSNKYLGKFSDLIRKILLSSKEQFISLEEEVEILSLYLDLEKLRFGEDFFIDLQCNVSEKQQDEIMLPAMFIQPYIENAIKHGLFHKEGKKELLVHFNIKNEALECIIQDNGIGQEKAAEFKQKRLHLHTGFSTEAINERIRLLNETSEKKIELIVEDLFEGTKAVGTKISLYFPI